MLYSLPSGGISSFGPLIIKGFGFNQVKFSANSYHGLVLIHPLFQFQTLLFNIPFSALQVITTILSAWISTRLKLKWPVIFGLCLPPIAGASGLYVLGRGIEYRNRLLGCYYVVGATLSQGSHSENSCYSIQLSLFIGLQPMLYAWGSQNTAGHTKKLCITAVMFVAQCVGNVSGIPLSS